jgi:hypothetical protein
LERVNQQQQQNVHNVLLPPACKEASNEEFENMYTHGDVMLLAMLDLVNVLTSFSSIQSIQLSCENTDIECFPEVEYTDIFARFHTGHWTAGFFVASVDYIEYNEAKQGKHQDFEAVQHILTSVEGSLSYPVVVHSAKTRSLSRPVMNTIAIKVPCVLFHCEYSIEGVGPLVVISKPASSSPPKIAVKKPSRRRSSLVVFAQALWNKIIGGSSSSSVAPLESPDSSLQRVESNDMTVKL